MNINRYLFYLVGQHFQLETDNDKYPCEFYLPEGLSLNLSYGAVRIRRNSSYEWSIENKITHTIAELIDKLSEIVDSKGIEYHKMGSLIKTLEPMVGFILLAHNTYSEDEFQKAVAAVKKAYLKSYPESMSFNCDLPNSSIDTKLVKRFTQLACHSNYTSRFNTSASDLEIWVGSIDFPSQSAGLSIRNYYNKVKTRILFLWKNDSYNCFVAFDVDEGEYTMVVQENAKQPLINRSFSVNVDLTYDTLRVMSPKQFYLPPQKISNSAAEKINTMLSFAVQILEANLSPSDPISN